MTLVRTTATRKRSGQQTDQEVNFEDLKGFPMCKVRSTMDHLEVPSIVVRQSSFRAQMVKGPSCVNIPRDIVLLFDCGKQNQEIRTQ